MAHQIYDNFVLSNKYESVLATKLNLQRFLTVDRGLVQDAGMTRKINVRTVDGQVDEVAMGEGNTHSIEVKLETRDYIVGTTQGRISWFDEQVMTDPLVVDNGLTGLAETMTNDFTTKAIAEWEKATLQQEFGSTAKVFDTVVDAIAMMNKEEETNLFLLINPGMKAIFRKDLADDLKYVEAFARAGYIGSVCGVPVYVSKAVPENTMYLATPTAVTLFMKKDNEMEQERDANIRKTTAYTRKVCLVALTDEREVVKIAPAQAVTATITAASGTSVAGAALTGSTIQAYVNGAKAGNAVTAASSAYSITVPTLAAGDEVKVIAKKTGTIDSVATATVA